MTIDALRLGQPPPADHATEQEHLAAMLRALPAPVSLVHLHHYDSLGFLPMLWRRLLAALVERGHAVLLSTCSGFDEESIEFLALHPQIFCQRRVNQGRCIGAYRDTALAVARLAAEGVPFRHVLLINDSILPIEDGPAPLMCLEELMALAGAAPPAAALSGLTESYERGHHLQSYGLCANASLLTHPAWVGFWTSLDGKASKQELIDNGEIGLSQAMAGAGVALRVVNPLISGVLLHPRASDDLAGLGDYRLDQINPSLFLWRTLREEGFPFVKKILLFSLPTRLGGPLALQQLMSGLPRAAQEVLAADLHRLQLGRTAAWGQAVADADLQIPPSPQAAEPPAPPSRLPTRLEELRRHVNREGLGLEVGPFHRPICAKREGFNCLVADLLPRQQLLEAYADDPDVMPLQEVVEEVDVLLCGGLLSSVTAYCEGPEARVKQAAGSLQYVLSSHNFEHLPDPIAFLDDAAVLLSEGGHLTMAIPVGSRCFDCFRPLSTTGQLIDAHQAARTRATLGALFDQSASAATLADGRTIGDRSYAIEQVVVAACGGTIDAEAFAALQFNHEFGHIGGIHSFVFNPYSFLLIFEDLQACGFLPLLRIREVIDRPGQEFIVHIARIPEADRCPLPLSAQRRTDLLRLATQYAIDDLRFAAVQETPAQPGA